MHQSLRKRDGFYDGDHPRIRIFIGALKPGKTVYVFGGACPPSEYDLKVMNDPSTGTMIISDKDEDGLQEDVSGSSWWSMVAGVIITPILYYLLLGMIGVL